MLVLRGSSNIAEYEVGLETAFLSHWIISQGVIVDDTEVVLPREAFHLLVESRSQRVSDVLLAELVDS